MTPDTFSELSIEQLAELQTKIAAKRQEMIDAKQSALSNAIAALIEIATSMGYSNEDVAKMIYTKPKVAVAVKFTSKDGSKTWTGRGKRPQWLALEQAAETPAESVATA
jgi:DNA-binding protein H-NS